MSNLSQIDLNALEATATSVAAYLDACDGGAKFVRLDPVFYRACGHLLTTIFLVVNADKEFPWLLKQSAAAREVAESIQIGRRIAVSRLIYYPHLAAILTRASA